MQIGEFVTTKYTIFFFVGFALLAIPVLNFPFFFVFGTDQFLLCFQEFACKL